MAELATSSSHVYSIPPGKSFVDVLAHRLRAAYGHDPLGLARVLVLLPSRRSASALQAAFLRQTDGAPSLLPRMQPLSDVDEDGLLSESWPGGALETLPPPIAPSLRHILLTRLVAHTEILRPVRAHAPDMEQAALLAQELARLLDAMARAEIGFEGLAALVPEELSAHWQKTVDFLDAIHRAWPRLLQEEGVMEAIPRRNALLHALAAQWQATPPDYPVIAAGSTGSQAATAALLRVIAQLPQGMVILPGLDASMADEEWRQLPEAHPQWGLRQILAGLNVKHADVLPLDDERIPPSCPPARVALLSRAMQPAPLTSAWREAEVGEGACAGITRMECENPREEAQAIALALRHALEQPGKRAGVVTQDRTLGRMIAAHMHRYGVQLDDSAGQPALQSPPGVFLLLLAEMAASRAAPVPLLALLKHPLTGLGLDPAECRQRARALEVHLLRGVRPAPGLEALARSIKPGAEHEARMRGLLRRLHQAAAEFMQALRQREAPFARLLALHLEAAEAVAAMPGGAKLWTGEAGEALSSALSDLSLSAPRLGVIEARHYAGVLETLLAQQVVRPAYGTHPRLHILGPIEARLQHFDLVILAGLNEGSWPREIQPSPWMSRPMMQRFGLPLSEEDTGKSAHDFALLACGREVLLTRSRKVEGAATTPSRWWLRLETLLSASGQPPLAQAEYLSWARQMDADVQLAPFRQPAPCPPVEARPQRLSVTEIETWQRDPYVIYAKHVLGLRPLNTLDEEPSLREFGQIVHRALELFALEYPQALPPDVEAALLRAGEHAFAPLADRPAVVAFWQPRFQAMVPWLAQQERARRGALVRLLTECKGRWALEAAGVPFTLKTTLDRLELHADGSFSVIDYKTGGIPKPKDRDQAISLQLPLEALVVQHGAMDLPQAASSVRELSYWKLSGAKNEAHSIDTDCTGALARLHELIAAFAQADMPYLAQPDDSFAPAYNDYAHLERKEEWEWQE